MSKEQIYDEQINPLMDQIIAICKENKIAMVASFAIPSDTDPNIRCTSALLTKEFNPPQAFIKAMGIIRPPERMPLMIRIQNTDGSQTLTAILG